MGDLFAATAAFYGHAVGYNSANAFPCRSLILSI